MSSASLRAPVHRGDRRLQRVRTESAAANDRVEERHALGDLRAVPARPVLLLERDDVALGVEPRAGAGVGEQQEREETPGLARRGEEADQETREPDRLGAEVGADRRVALGGGVALGEDQVDDRHDRLADLSLGAWWNQSEEPVLTWYETNWPSSAGTQ